MKGLGKGLDALLGGYEAPNETAVSTLSVYLIDNNSDQPRKKFDEAKLVELANSIAQHGIVQPIIVRKVGERYSIIAGERRFRAARRAGLNEVPVIVREMDEQQVLEVSLIENLQRENLNALEEAAAIRTLMDEHDLTQDEVAKRLGKSRPAIANAVRLLSLPEELQAQIPEHLRGPLLEVLAQDPRAAYNKKPDYIYGMAFDDYDIRFTVAEGILTVKEVTRRTQEWKKVK